MAAKKKAKKKAAKKKAAAKKPTVKAIKEPMTKSALYTELAERTELKKKEIVMVFDELSNIINGHVRKNGAGVFTDSGQSLGIAITLDIALGDIDDDGGDTSVEYEDPSSRCERLAQFAKAGHSSQ